MSYTKWNTHLNIALLFVSVTRMGRSLQQQNEAETKTTLKP
jgi:hypothetical protein